MEERAACAQLKRRFEAAGFRITENQSFDEDGVRFEIDGFDAARRVGYEYVTAEAGDGWDVDGDVIAALSERRKRGELHVLVVDEADAPDAALLDQAIDAFLAELPVPEPAAATIDAPQADAPASAIAAPAAKAEAPREPEPEPEPEVAADADVEEVEAEPEAAPPPVKAKAKTKPPPTPASPKGAKKKPARKSK